MYKVATLSAHHITKTKQSANTIYLLSLLNNMSRRQNDQKISKLSLQQNKRLKKDKAHENLIV